MEISMVLESYLIYDDEYYDFAYEGEGGGIWNAIKGFFQKILEKIKKLKDRLVQFLKRHFTKDGRAEMKSNRESNRAYDNYVKTLRDIGKMIPVIIVFNEKTIELARNILAKFDEAEEMYANIKNETIYLDKRSAQLRLTELNITEKELRVQLKALQQRGPNNESSKEWAKVFSAAIKHAGNQVNLINRALSRAEKSEE